MPNEESIAQSRDDASAAASAVASSLIDQQQAPYSKQKRLARYPLSTVSAVSAAVRKRRSVRRQKRGVVYVSSLSK